MSKSKIKLYVCRTISTLVLLAVLAGSLWYVNRAFVLKRTDGITTMQNFYEQEKNTVDVLLLGSSHSGMNLDTDVLWTEFGMPSYALWGSVQPFWNSYHFLIEALKTQSPSVVVLDVYAATFQKEYSDDARRVTNIAGMKLSANKIEAIKVSTEEERWTDLLLGMPIYHTRYDELSQNDFSHFPWSEGLTEEKGSGCRYGIGKCTIRDVSQIEKCEPLHEKQEEYLLKIIDLCEKENLPLLLVTTPTVTRTAEQPYYNSVAKIAEEKKVPYLNFNLMDNETGITEADYWTDNVHLNTEGTRKVSLYLGKYLKDNYSLKDYRGETRYDSWNANAENLRRKYLKLITDPADYIEEIKNNDWELVLVNYGADVAATDVEGNAIMGDEFMKFLQQAGIEETCFDGETYSAWSIDAPYTETNELSGAKEGATKIKTSAGNISIAYDKASKGTTVTYPNGKKVVKKAQLYFAVIDKDDNSLLDSGYVSFEDGFVIGR